MSKYSLVILICSLLVVLIHAVPEGRILGGWLAISGQFPFQVSLKVNGGHTCGGSIISKNYILTAAHCVVDKRNNYSKLAISTLTVEAGTTLLEGCGVRIPVAKTIVHPRYFYDGNSADIALVRLAESLTFSTDIKPIELANDDIPDNTPVVICGWGRLRQNGPSADQLQWTVLHSISHLSFNKMLYLSHPRNKGICIGDSGGPGVVDHRLVGVASFILKKCGTYRPDGYVKVSRYLDWIESHSDVEDLNVVDFWTDENYDQCA